MNDQQFLVVLIKYLALLLRAANQFCRLCFRCKADLKKIKNSERVVRQIWSVYKKLAFEMEKVPWHAVSGSSDLK